MNDERGNGDSRRVVSVGRDRATVGHDRLVIHSPVDMPEWDVRPFRKPAFVFDGRRWELVAKTAGSHDTVRYDLSPWPADRADPPVREIAYDEAFVRQRDADLAAEVTRARQGLVWFLLLPFVGLLWTGPKSRLQDRHFLPVMDATRQSVFLEYLTLLVCGLLFTITAFTSVVGGIVLFSPLPLLVALLVLFVDVVYRKDALLRGDPIPPGFYEWMVRRTAPPGWGTGEKRRDGRDAEEG